MRDSILHNSLRSSTHKSYDSKERKWLKFCRIHNIDPHNQGTDVFLNFIAWIFRNKGKWGYIKGFPPALAKYFNNKYIDRTQVSWMLKGIFNLRPPVSRYTAIWDVNIVLHYIAAMIVDNYKDRVRKMAILLMLLSGNRVNMLSHFKVSNMFITNNECTFVFDEALKTSRPNWNTDPMVFRVYPELPSLCPVNNINDYLAERNTMAGDDAFFITHAKPHHGAAPGTIARWIKDMLCLSGIDSGRYTAHSCRSAVTSAAAFGGISLTTIIKSASWSNVTTFKKFYLKEITEFYDKEKENFGEQTLSNYADSCID